MSASSEHSEHGSDHGFAHPQSISSLLTVFSALVILTIITVLIANFKLGNAEIWISLTIASIKASLVMYFFMHLGHDKPFNALIFLSSTFFLALFMGLTMMDRNAYRSTLEPIIDAPYVNEALEEIEEVVPALEDPAVADDTGAIEGPSVVAPPEAQ